MNTGKKKKTTKNEDKLYQLNKSVLTDWEKSID